MSERRVDTAASAAPGGAVRKPALHALTGVRGLLLFPVLAAHSREFMQDVLPVTRVLDNFVMSAFLAVDVFFLLSGFVLSYNYAERFARFGRAEYRGYFVSRFARIYPVYAVTLVLTGVVVGWWGLADRDLTVAGFVSNFFMLQTMPHSEAWNLPSWSVACEVGAYLVFPFVAAALLRVGWRTALVVAVLEVAVLVVAVRLLFDLEGAFPFNLYYWVRLVVDFSLGCLMWVVWRQKVRRGRRWDVAVVAALLLIAVVVHLRHQTPISYVAVGLLALFVLAAASATGPIRSALSWRPLAWLGETSYSVYLVHYPVFVVLFALLPTAAITTASLPVRVAAVAVFFVLPILLGAGLFHAIEEPTRRSIRRRVGASRGVAAGAGEPGTESSRAVEQSAGRAS